MELRRRVSFYLIFIFSPFFLFSEGTKQFRPLENHKGELCIDTTRNKFGSVSASADYRLYIHISDFNTEAIYFGFGETKHNFGASEFRLYRPDGSIDTSGAVPTATGTRGYIDDWAHAVAGPSVVAGATGYWALRCTPDQNGDYYLAFKITWQTGWGIDNYKTWANFDATVVNTTSWAASEGRVWSKAWQLYAEMPNQGSANQYWGSLFAYSADSIVTKVDLNGMIPVLLQYPAMNQDVIPLVLFIRPILPVNQLQESIPILNIRSFLTILILQYIQAAPLEDLIILSL